MKHTTRLERLKHLLTIIEKTPDHNFDMSLWGEKTHACGTHACLLGNAALDKEFNQQGLKGIWVKHKVFSDVSGRYVNGAGLKITCDLISGTGYTFDDAMASGRAFFGIDKATAAMLFTDDTDAKGRAAKRAKKKQVRELIKKYTEEYKQACANLNI